MTSDDMKLAVQESLERVRAALKHDRAARDSVRALREKLIQAGYKSEILEGFSAEIERNEQIESILVDWLRENADVSKL